MVDAPLPHDTNQLLAFPGPIETTFGPLQMHLTISLQRVPRRKCTACGNRRICFSVGLGERIQSPPMCAKCAGIR